MMEMDENSSMAGLERNVGREITPAVRALQQGLGKKLVAIVLFGSRARGDAMEESDWDILIIAEDLPELPMERYRKTKEILQRLERQGLHPGKDPAGVRSSAVITLPGDRSGRADTERSARICYSTIAEIAPSDPGQGYQKGKAGKGFHLAVGNFPWLRLVAGLRGGDLRNGGIGSVVPSRRQNAGPVPSPRPDLLHALPARALPRTHAVGRVGAGPGREREVSRRPEAGDSGARARHYPGRAGGGLAGVLAQEEQW